MTTSNIQTTSYFAYKLFPFVKLNENKYTNLLMSLRSE